jgi:N-acyl-D-amino-acid deacylase
MLNRRQFTRRTLLGSLGFALGCSLNNRFDVIIKNGIVYDGSISPGKRVDIGIKKGIIETLDSLSEASADRIIDATDMAIAPGFIDIHTHTDTNLIIDPRAESKVMQGVTTEIGGNCGSSPFPLNDVDFETLNQHMKERYEVEVTWRDADGYLATIQKSRPALNFITLTGHGDLRSCVVGKNDVKPTVDQIKEMQHMLSQSIEQGSFGLSTGLEYAPGSYADTDELIQLCIMVAQHNGLYATHMRNEDDTVIEAIDEALKISRQSGVNLEIAHLKAANPANWHKVEKMLSKISMARDSGMNVNADRYPYIAYGTGMTIFLPLWTRQGSREEILARLEDKKLLPTISEYTQQRGERIGGWDRVQISYVRTEENKKWEGKTIAECAATSNITPFEFIRTILIQEKNQVGIVGFAMDENNLKKILSHPYVMVGSDGSAVSPRGKLGEGKPHPRYYGTFPRILGKYCREEKIFDLATAIHKISAMPAQKLGLKKRGEIKKGYKADVVVFNPLEVRDKATFSNPHQFPEGIYYVMVNGTITVEKGRHTGAAAGTVIRHNEV